MAHPRKRNSFIEKLTSVYAVSIISYSWGLAEGIFFFIVPDVYIFFVVLFSPKNGLRSWVYSIFGSLSAVIVLWIVSALFSASEMQSALIALPGITPELMSRVLQSVAVSGLPTTPFLALTGIPLKVYVLSAFFSGYTLPTVLLWTLFARVIRIAPGYIMMVIVRKFLIHSIETVPMRAIKLYSFIWTVFYVFYFLMMGF